MTKNSDCKKFYVIGLNYKKADVVTRSNFSLSKEKQKQLLSEAKQININSVVILSTCNRIEIMGFAKHPFQLISLLCKYSKGTVEEFAKVSYVYKNSDASEHIIRIATGVDSQILGDYEIVGQLKDAFNLAKEAGTLNAYLERLFNVSLQASKETKNKTSISSGTTTVSYAAIQYIKDKYSKKNPQNILVYGLGDIGKSTARSCAEYLKAHHITVINRTDATAHQLGTEVDVHVAMHQELENLVQSSDIIVVATGASNPTLTANMMPSDKKQLVIDLSIPRNADPLINDLENCKVIDVDILSEKTKKTIEDRKKQIPLVEEIIQKHKSEFYEWLMFRRSTPAINSLKKSLELIQKDAIISHAKKHEQISEELLENVTSQMINKIVSKFAMHLKAENTQANQSIKVMKEVFNLETTEN
ncbi:glutamyl-tRNA reductase [Lutimonas sp.]|uniref:glutamyl-tRNA reductase n=1 Tax=Lutimonas sp. TaxID=1872403 RepID=UPI003D9B682C